MARIPEESTLPSRRGVSLQSALIARRFYVDGLQKSEIADEFGISRFKVARMLDDAKAAGIVRIHVNIPSEADLELGEALAERYDVTHAFVARVGEANSEFADMMMATLAADYLMSAVSPHDVLGMSWGSSVARVVHHIHSLPAIDTVQLVGGVRSSDLDTNGTELVRRLSHVSGGQAFPLMAPLLVDSPTTASALRSEAAVAQAMARFSDLTIALVGIGSWVPQRSSLASEISDADRSFLLGAGATADVSAIVLTSEGQEVESPLSERTLSISFSELAAVPNVVAVAGGVDKTLAIKAALQSRLISVLVTDSEVAKELLAAGRHR